MHPAIPIVIMAALIALLEEEQIPPPPEKPEPAREKIVLLPDAEGNTGRVIVQSSGSELVLEHPYAAADVYTRGKLDARNEDAGTVRSRFAAVIAAQPPRPVSVTVYFVFDKEELTADSAAQFDRIKRELAARPAPEIVVIGHTDRVGAAEYNDKLSLRRAEHVRDALAAAGVSRAQIDVAGRGEREPAIATADEVHEPRNRRVEITVR
jgi:outer membrane protein OmpA-like peptidoglycan-associated protein